MRWLWPAGTALLAIGGAGWVVERDREARREVVALARRLDQVLLENRLRRPGEPPSLEEPKDLATWAAEIDRIVQESYGQLLKLSLSEAQIRSVVQSLAARVEGGVAPDLSNPQTRAELKAVVDALVSEHLYERGYILKRKTPDAAEVAERLSLAGEAREGFLRIFSDVRVNLMDLARAKLPEGVDLLTDLYRLENLAWASPDRAVLEWKLLAVPLGGNRTFQAWLSDQERLVGERLAGLLTPDQMARFQFLKLVPWDLVGVALSSPQAPPGR